MVMSRLLFSTFLFLSLLLSPVLSSAEESKEEKLSSDQTQQRYQRKSITYLGPVFDRGVTVPEDYWAVIEKAIRSKTELKRFDYNAINLGSIYTIDQFVAELREFVKKRSMDRAAAEAEYEERFKSARVYMSDIDRIMNSAYFYTIKMYAFRVNYGKCPDSKAAALLMGCVPGVEGMVATVSATTTFYRANLTDDTKPPYELIREVKHGTAMKGFEELIVTEVQPEHMERIKKEKGLKATAEAAGALALFLSKGMKQIPDFQLKTPVTAALSDGVEFMLGKDEGVGLDDTYDVTEFDAAGKKSLLGYVKVRDIGDAKGTGDGTPSYAEKVKEKRKFVGGEQLFEHPMIGLSLGVHGILEVAFFDMMEQDGGTAFYPGVGLYIDYDLANVVKWPEFYAGVEADILFLGTDSFDNSWMLIHAMVGVKKKWYMNSLVFNIGLRGGISYYKIDNYEDDAIGGGADLSLGLEYYFMPEFSVYFKVAGRFFTNPLMIYGDADPEAAVQANLGVFLAI